MERIAGAPITWGVCEVPDWGHQLGPDRVLAEMSGIGLRATELGPEGFLPTDPERLRGLLGGYGLDLVGGFLPVTLHLGEGLEDRLERVAAYADLLSRAGSDVLVLAATTPEAAYEVSPDLDRDEWMTLVGAIDRAVEIAGERGLALALHPHHGTVIEQTRHVERLLETTSTSLCLDTGHLLVGGTDPLDVARSAASRVAHVHMKDVGADWAERVRTGRSSYAEAVGGGMYRPLGRGDLDILAIVRTLDESGYGGWYVLEQDTVLAAAPDEGAGPVHEARASLEFFRRLAAELEQDTPAAAAGEARAALEATSTRREEGR
jgi:inosose dehydratase